MRVSVKIAAKNLKDKNVFNINELMGRELIIDSRFNEGVLDRINNNKISVLGISKVQLSYYETMRQQVYNFKDLRNKNTCDRGDVITYIVTDDEVHLNVYKTVRRYEVVVTLEIEVKSDVVYKSNQVVQGILHYVDGEGYKKALTKEEEQKVCLALLTDSSTVFDKRRQDHSDYQELCFFSGMDAMENFTIIGLSDRPYRVDYQLDNNATVCSNTYVDLLACDFTTHGSSEKEVSVYLDESNAILEVVSGTPEWLREEKIAEMESTERQHTRKIRTFMETVQVTPFLEDVRTWFYLFDVLYKNKSYSASPWVKSATLLNDEFKAKGKDRLFAKIDKGWYEVSGFSNLGDIWLTDDIKENTSYMVGGRVMWPTVLEWSFDNNVIGE